MIGPAVPAETAARELLARVGERVAAQRHLPESTYRLQFHAGFTFRDATAIAPYLRDLGITHLYASPYLMARPGSTHGYDVIDPHRLNPELGTEADYAAFVAAMRSAGLEHILDVVPNHVGVATNDNEWWNDVLTHGPKSVYAEYFDIAWRGSPRPELHDKLLLPVLGDLYGETLEKGLLQLAFEDGEFYVRYYDRRFPLSPESSARILEHAPDGDIEQAVTLFNGTPGEARTFDRLDELLERQHYRLAWWRVAPDEINYRRFFDINDLAALRMEREDVFNDTHLLIFKLLTEGALAGIRLDHPDGLYDPKQYFQRLQRQYLLATARLLFEEDDVYDGLAWEDVRAALRAQLDASPPGEGAGRWPLYAVAEKILAADEALPPEWAVHGTTGYDFLVKLNGLFVNAKNAAAFTSLYETLTGDSTPFADLVYLKKRLILKISLASELQMLAHQLDRLSQQDRRSRDFTLSGLRIALREVVACFPVYRSYTTDEGFREADRPAIDAAVDGAIARNPATSPAIFEYVRDMLLLRYPERATEEHRAGQRRFAGKFQQVTAPVTAKGIEDTAFYLYNRLISLNEVGGDPDRFGESPEELHRYFTDRRTHWPYALSCLSTHDTKRSEDVRARLNVLSEMPEEWAAILEVWRKENAPHRREVNGALAPDANEEYLIYQTLLGAWPLGEETGRTRDAFAKRVKAFVEKALREAKLHSSWTRPDEAYESAVLDFVAAILDEARSSAFLADFRVVHRLVSHHGLLNSLGQTVLRLTAPGVPDTYQGTELWDFSLVDPDNRRPVDYDHRRRMLGDLDAMLAGPDRAAAVRAWVAAKEDGRIKLLVTALMLRCRRDHPGLFSEGEYLPLEVTGAHRDHVFAFARRHGDQLAVIAVSRLPAGLIRTPHGLPVGEGVWQDTTVVLPETSPDGPMQNLFTGETIATETPGRLRLAKVFAALGVAVLLPQR